MKIMAVDYGDARTGLAVCDRTEFLASPIGIIEEKSLAKVAEKIVYASREYEVGMIVIGLPKNMDGSEGPRAQKSHKLADTLRAIVPIPVELWDERQTWGRCPPERRPRAASRRRRRLPGREPGWWCER